MTARSACIILIGLSAVTLSSANAGPAWTGYRGPEGSGVFPDSNPPVDCDMRTGRNILWRTPLPNWCHAGPLIVRNRAFVMSEPGWKHDWPVLTCVDVTCGKVLWECEINHLCATGLDETKQKEVAKKWRDFHAEWRKLYTTFAETVGQGDQDTAKARFKEMGRTFGGHRGGGYGQLRRLKPRPNFNDRKAGL